MGVHLEWDEHKQVATIRVEMRWTWEEYQAVTDNAFGQIAALNYPVAIIADIARMGPLPKGNFLRHLQYAAEHTPKNVYATVLVGAPYVVTTFLNVVMKVRPNPTASVLFASSVDEAKKLIQQHHQGSFQGKVV